MVGLSRKRVFPKTKGDSITGQDSRVGVIKIVIVINCNLITFSKVIA